MFLGIDEYLRNCYTVMCNKQVQRNINMALGGHEYSSDNSNEAITIMILGIDEYIRNYCKVMYNEASTKIDQTFSWKSLIPVKPYKMIFYIKFNAMISCSALSN